MGNDLIDQIDSYALTNKTALKMHNKTVSYSELKYDTEKIANYISNISYGIQSPIVIYMKRSILFIEFMIGIIKAGSYYIPLEDNIPISRVMDIIADSGATNIVVDDNTFASISIKTFNRKVNIINIKNIHIDTKNEHTTDIKKDTLLFQTYNDTHIDYNKLVYVIYTSGSSGIPKGVKIKYSNLQNLVEAFYDILYSNIPKQSNIGVVASFSFDSSVKQIYCALYYGHCLCIAEDKDKYFGQRLISFFRNNQIEVSDITPTHLKLLIMQKKYDECFVGTLLIGGEKLRYETLYDLECKMKKIPVLINVYGPTECCVDVAYNYIFKDEILEQQVGDVPIGRAINNSRIFLRNNDGIIIEKNEEVGELCITGAPVGAGYVNASDTAFVMGEYGPEYRSGDLAYYDIEDKLIVVGRKDKQIKIHGNRIEPNEIANVIEKITGCKCFVVCLSHNNGKFLAAYLVEKKDLDISLAELKNKLKDYLPLYMIPKFYVFADKIPLTQNGKVNEKCIIETIERRIAVGELDKYE